MSVTSTAMFLFHGFNEERHRAGGQWPEALWPDVDSFNGFIGLIDHMESMAIEVEQLWEKEHAGLDYGGVYDYEITEELGSWMYLHPDAGVYEFNQEQRRLFNLGAAPLSDN